MLGNYLQWLHYIKCQPGQIFIIHHSSSLISLFYFLSYLLVFACFHSQFSSKNSAGACTWYYFSGIFTKQHVNKSNQHFLKVIITVLPHIQQNYTLIVIRNLTIFIFIRFLLFYCITVILLIKIFNLLIKRQHCYTTRNLQGQKIYVVSFGPSI